MGAAAAASASAAAGRPRRSMYCFDDVAESVEVEKKTERGGKAKGGKEELIAHLSAVCWGVGELGVCVGGLIGVECEEQHTTSS